MNASPAQSADTLRPGRLDADTRDALRPGLAVRFETADGALTDARADRLAALCVPAGQSPTPFLPPGRFRATFSGYLKNRLRGTFRLHLEGRGRATLTIGEAEVLAVGPGEWSAEPVPVELVKGYNPLRIDYESTADADALLRVYWTGDDFPAEPLPADALLYDSREPALKSGLAERAGRFTVARLNCIKCHALPETVAAAETPMPELRHDAPSLAESGRRLEPAWVAKWILDPAAMRNEATMPGLLDPSDEADRETAADLAAFLATVGPGPDGGDAGQPSKELLDRGEFLYEYRGCIACHRFSPPDEADAGDWNRVSLRHAAAKYRPGVLAEFLQDSRKHYAWSRMPRFTLSDDEAAALAAYVRSRSKGDPEELTVGDPRRGAESFVNLGCAACHATDAEEELRPLAVKPLFETDPSKGCLAADDSQRGDAPDFRLSDVSLAAVARFLQSDHGSESLTRTVSAEFSRRQIPLLNCTACHERDVTEPRLPTAIGLEGNIGQLPDEIPPLTWAGEKLDPAWTVRLLSGDLGYRLRPHFRTHMPAFPARAEWLAVGLSHEHGFPAVADPGPEYDEEAALVGREVIAMQSGLACQRCHAIDDDPAKAPEQALSTNLSFARDRLRHGYFMRWMLFPQRIDPRTRMLKFAPDAKTTPLDIHGGDAEKQFEAVWHHLRHLQQTRTREKP